MGTGHPLVQGKVLDHRKSLSMVSRPSDRARQRGQSFTTCLLAVILVFGGIGLFYFKIFRWRDLEEPMERRTVVVIEEDEVATLFPFRKKAITNVIDPGGFELKRLTKFAKKTKKGKVVPPDWEQDTTEILTRLLEIMETAKLVREPKRYTKKYSYGLWGLHHTYMATLAYQEYCGAPPENPTVKKAAYKEMWKHIKKARANFKKGKAFFARSVPQ